MVTNFRFRGPPGYLMCERKRLVNVAYKHPLKTLGFTSDCTDPYAEALFADHSDPNGKAEEEILVATKERANKVRKS